jgi:hypothetical protein
VVKPRVIRINQKIKSSSNIKIVVKPNHAKISNLSQVRQQLNKQPFTVTPVKIIAKPQPPATKKTVSNGRNPIRSKNRKNKPTVRITTRDISPDSVAKLRNIQNTGIGRILVILGNGPSLGEINLPAIRNLAKVDLLTVNHPDERVWPTKYWSFFDRSQLRRHEAIWNSYNGYIFNSTAIKEQKANSMQFRHIPGHGWSTDIMKGIHIGRSSVFASMQIAAWMNYNHVFILGCDMASVNGKLHSYGVNPDVLPDIRVKRFSKEAESYDRAADLMTESERKRFIFCSEYNLWPFIQKYNHMSHKTAVEQIIQTASQLGIAIQP